MRKLDRMRAGAPAKPEDRVVALEARARSHRRLAKLIIAFKITWPLVGLIAGIVGLVGGIVGILAFFRIH